MVLFAKVPVHGAPKSRIAQEAGRARADAIYEELLAITAERIRGFELFVSYSGFESPGSLEALFPKALGFLPQHGHTLGLRVQNALHNVKDRGFDAVCAIGTDCPHLAAADIEDAFARLDKGCDVVIGPAEDGGYYLIALKSPDCGVFHVEGWSTPRLLVETKQKMKALGLSYRLLETKYDIDTLAAYERWKRGH